MNSPLKTRKGQTERGLRRRRWGFVVSILFVLAAATTRAADPDGPARAIQRQIADAWTQRAERVKSARFAWQTSVFRRGLKLPPGAPKNNRTDKELSYAWRGTFAFSRNDECRYHRVGQQPNLGGSALVGLDNLFVMEGPGVFKSFHPAELGNGISHGFFLERPFHATAELWPIHWHYRAGPEKLLIDLDLFEIDPEPIPFGELTCYRLSRPIEKSQRNPHLFYVAPSLGYAIVHADYFHVNGALKRQIDVDYTRDRAGDPVLQGWRHSWFTGGARPAEMARFDVTEAALNPVIAATDFRLVFPPGCWVADEVRSVQYIELEGGKQRIVTDEEADTSVPYKVLIATPTGRSDRYRVPRHDHLVVQVVVCLNVLLIYGIVAWKIWKSRRKAT